MRKIITIATLLLYCANAQASISNDFWKNSCEEEYEKTVSVLPDDYFYMEQPHRAIYCGNWQDRKIIMGDNERFRKQGSHIRFVSNVIGFIILAPVTFLLGGVSLLDDPVLPMPDEITIEDLRYTVKQRSELVPQKIIEEAQVRPLTLNKKL